MEQLTKKELELLKELIITSPLHGNLQTLPPLMGALAEILRKLDGALNEKPNPDQQS